MPDATALTVEEFLVDADARCPHWVLLTASCPTCLEAAGQQRLDLPSPAVRRIEEAGQI